MHLSLSSTCRSPQHCDRSHSEACNDAAVALQKWREAKAQLEGVLGGCGGPGQPHELHVHCIDCRTPLLNCCNAASDTKGALAHLSVMISAMRAILGEPTVF